MGDDTLDPQNEIDRKRDIALIRAALKEAAKHCPWYDAERIGFWSVGMMEYPQ